MGKGQVDISAHAGWGGGYGGNTSRMVRIDNILLTYLLLSAVAANGTLHISCPELNRQELPSHKQKTLGGRGVPV
jgi:hypothetical protein